MNSGLKSTIDNVLKQLGVTGNDQEEYSETKIYKEIIMRLY